ncbi:MAG TPA: hypothetical protein VE421_10265 [Burkholderiaceae bacterium]|jgi:hypothetical protein|nr:hypothetical protein [Burkholderiaceae bacterium]
MIAGEPAVTVHEVSMQEWAMLAFHAERAPRRVRVTVNPARAANDACAIASSRKGFWFLMAVAIAGLAWWLI